MGFFGMNLGIECEIFLLKQAEDGTLSVPDPGGQADQVLLRRARLYQQLWLAGQAWLPQSMTWAGDLYSFDHEDANGQFEFDFQYADALTTCDRLTFFRFMAKHYAREEGLLATMMPKPFADKTGNGAHFNMSLYDLAEVGWKVESNVS